MDGTTIANAFNQQNDKKTWAARAMSRERKSGAVDVVHFTAKGGMVSLDYDVAAGRFMVKFNKFQGAWGDYVKAIGRSLYVILNTLKSAGLPYEAPTSLNGMTITATLGDDNSVYVSWEPQTPAAATMPEIRGSMTYPDGVPGTPEYEPARILPEFDPKTHNVCVIGGGLPDVL